MPRDKTTLMGSMLAKYRITRDNAIRAAKHDLWVDNKMAKPEDRSGHELREKSVVKSGGQTVVDISLWKRIDTKRVVVSSNIQAETIEAKVEDLDDLMK